MERLESDAGPGERWRDTGALHARFAPQRVQWAARAGAGLCLGTATLVLAGWAAGADSLTRLGMPWTPMAAPTAFALAAAAAAVLALARGWSPSAARIAGGAGLVMAATALVVLADVGSSWLRGAPLYPRTAALRMAPNTAAAVLLLGAALGQLSRPRGRRWIAEALVAGALLIAVAMLVAFLLGAATVSDLMGRVNMSPLTAIHLAVLASALLFLVPSGIAARVLLDDAEGSLVARRLLGLVVLGPLGLGWLRLQLERAGLITSEYGVAVMIIGTAVLAAVAIGWGALHVNGYIAERSALLEQARHELARRREAEAELRALTAGLERRVAERTAELAVTNRELESFSYSVSHDLRAPLRALDGFSQAVLEDHAHRLDDKGRDYLHRIRRAAQRMAGLIDALLELSRVSRAPLAREVVDLTALARDIVQALREAAPDRMVQVHVQDRLAASGDPRLLRALLQNLLGNAWKFTARRADACIEFVTEAHEGRPQPVFVVRDNGAGFDMAYASKLFGAFQRLHSTEFEGTGVGLATAQRIVHRHAGDIWAAAAPGEGAAFYFTLS